ncbi:DNA repair protein RecN [Flavobacteriaceae bacterium]|nr:DNA repair protein RecN [Flavobacteriaceae bacterium]MDC1492391.1 DNA repair protein RecN [Flavobacteriaceae bacterium]
MLKNLSIKNYALIDDLNVDFNNGLSIITGETGAGKSILINALSLVLGKRSDNSSINNLNKKCIVEATFDLANYNLKKIFTDNNLDYDTDTIIRREILPSGKSRAFVNDSPVVLNQLTSISKYIIDIHSQHQNLDLVNVDFQFDVIDSVANNLKILKQYKLKLHEFKTLKTQLESLRNTKLELSKAYDYNNHLLQEINDLNISTINLNDLENSYKDLSNFEDIKIDLNQSISILNDNELGIISLVNKLKFSLKNLSSKSNTFLTLYNRVNSIYIDLDDVSSDIQDSNENLVNNPVKLSEISDILSKLNNVLRKHSVDNIDDLKVIESDLLKKVSKSNNIDNEIFTLNVIVNDIQVELFNLGKLLSNNRINAIPKLVTNLQEVLVDLGMKSAQFLIEINSDDKFLSNGTDKLAFKFSANKGSDFKLLKQSASGGEISRIMLAIKSIIANYRKLPTLMFDEIDTGVSGEVSNKIGDIMKEMSSRMQIFTITHLPQIAAKGESHFKVFKTELDNSTTTNLIKLNNHDRIVEIAKMLEGDNISTSAVAHAKQLLN